MPTRALAAGLAVALFSSPLGATTVCPQTSPVAGWSGTTLDTGTVKSGIVYDGTGARLQLQNGAGQFRSTSLGISDHTVFAAVADFDRDGWDDFVGADEPGNYLRIYKNRTFDNPEPDWTDVNAVRQPKFVCGTSDPCHMVSPEGSNSTAVVKRRPTVAADFNGDGWPDVVTFSADVTGTYTEVFNSGKVYLNKGVNNAGYPTWKTSYNALATDTTFTNVGQQPWGGTTIKAVDYNGDRKIDIMISSGDSGGTIRVLLNNCTASASSPAAPAPLLCATDPKFTQTGAGVILTSMGMGSSGTARHPVFDFADVDGDGLKDLVAGAPSCCSTAGDRLRMWKGKSGGGFSSTPQSITYPGGATVVFLHDFSGDGKPDLIVGADNWNYNSGRGGDAYYWINNGTATPFSTAPQQLTTHDDTTLLDYDVGFMFNYDHDPANTMDLMIADGNHTGSFFVQVNRVAATFVDCGEAASGVLDLGPLATSEMVVTAARIHPTYTLNGGSIAFYMSNETPENWVLATACPDDAAYLCASFPKPVGREVRWKVNMCSNSTHTRTPSLSNLTATFDYTAAREHFRAGVVVNDGVAYLGGFRQPGDRGHLYAVNAALSNTYWDAANAIDNASDATRKIYTATTSGTTRLDFTTANASNSSLQSTLAVADASQASAVISWVRSARFGVGNASIAKSRLGSIETSTPAVLSPPGFPSWYLQATASDKLKIDAFRTAQSTRRTLVMFGAKDGMIHAVQSAPTSITTSPSGTEAWAFVPPKIAAGMIADYTNSQSTGTTTVASYPDGSPTLVDIRRTDGSFGTLALVASGNGGKSLMALDVTQTVNPSTGAIIGPTPLWNQVPGEAEAGQATAKPAVARVLIAGTEKFVAIAASGIANDNPAAPYTKGRVVAAYDVNSGRLLWRFQAQCPVTSDPVAIETNDETGTTYNGYIDRVLFADACGYVYKLDAAKDLDGGWNDNTGLGAIAIDPAITTTGSGPEPTAQYALFSTRLTTGALGIDSPIAGTMAVSVDDTTRAVAFFGTGGIESYAPTATNEFYAMYIDTGELRSKMAGDCTAAGCEKFYGGVLATTTNVVATRTIDPLVGTNTCDTGQTKVDLLSLNADTDGSFIEEATPLPVGSAAVGSIYGHGNAIYFATLSGEVVRIGTPRAANAGDDSANPSSVPAFGQGNESTTTGTVGTNTPLTLLGWRQVY